MSLAASAGRGLGAVWSPTHVQVTVLQARGLRAKGPGGTSDAYAVIQVGKEKYATSVSERSLGAPVWREEATFELPPLLSAEAAPAAAATLQLTVLHRALLGLDKFLGRAEVDLRELHRDQGHRKTQWCTLKSKPGKKNKERGEIEVDIQFMRNNMTASMFDLSMKDKSRNPFGKLKDKIKGKNKDRASDTVSAILPSVTPSADSDDESPSKDKKKKSKLKTFFSRPNLQRAPLSQSMSVLPTAKSDKVLLRPGDFQSQWEDEDNDEDKSSSASDVLSHKGTASVDPKQLNQIHFNPPKKEGLSFLGGLRSKNDILSRSNVCINGNHVYVEQPEAKSETKGSSPASSPSPQGLRKKHLFSSTENLACRPLKEPGEGGAGPSESSTKDFLKSTSLPSYQPLASGDLREDAALATLEAAKETKESKKQENKKPSLLSLVTGKKDPAKGSEGESPPAAPRKEREGMPVAVRAGEDQPGPVDGPVKRSDEETAAIVSGRGRAPNPFEDMQIPEPEADPEPKPAPAPPVPSPGAPRTRAVKPRLEVSPEAQPAPMLPPSSLSPLVFSALPSSSGQTPVPSKLGHDSEPQSSESPPGSSFSSPVAAPISTSTPIEHWPPADVGEASPEEPPSLLEPELEKESLTQVPSTVPCAVGSLSKQTPIPVGKGLEDSPVGKTSTDDPGQSLQAQPEVGQEEDELLGSPPGKQQGAVPSSVEAREVTSTTALRRGGMGSPAGEPPRQGASGSAGQSRSPVGDADGGGGMRPAVKEVVPPVPVGELVPPLDSAMQRHEEMGPDACEGRKEIEGQVLFSEQLSREEAGEQAPVLVRGDRGDPQEVTPQRAAPGNAWDTGHSQEGAAVAGPRPAALAARPPHPSSKGSFLGDPAHAASSGRDGPCLRSQGDDTRMARNQSKASDHKGLLSDPLLGLHSACEAKLPVPAHLDLTLPSIPEVASEDERGDQLEDDRGVAPVAALGGGASSPSTWPARAERERAPSGEAGGSAGVLREARPGAPRAPAPASAEQTTALAVQEPQSPGPGDSGEAKPVGDGRPSQPPATALDSLVSGPPCSEPFPATRSFPTCAHSDTHHTSTAESQKKAAVEGSAGKVENSGKRKPLLQAWVSPSDTQPVSAQPSAGSGSAKHRLHPVKPMNTAATKVTLSSSGTATVISENLVNEAMMKKYKPSEPAFAYAQLTHDELIQLVLKQKETISKKECQVRQLEDYIDNLLVRVMEETPSILRVPSQVGKKAGKM
ncbi:PREDICTED: rab11 family-interacting protein 1 isoform X1 [Lipotes vexillifer]|uniref:Rab11 family-interacting protein 1 n=1 Tax=Lipotes vexillifer TaxID=118797 RepID=A0A340WMR0_LIPVE|nr:PREDICTED: rab11 family-interacting protein 1 isoform X1 [Lipotes vexillifer]